MCGFVRALLFIYILFISINSAPYFLDPPFPPLAYIGQNYDLKFQVRGLPQLSFTFEGLPSFFTGSKDGSIKGTPIQTGSYKVGITYTSKNTTGSEQVILSIVTNETDLNSDIVLKMNTLQIESSASSWIYREGQTIQIEFWCSDAQEPLTISYRNLPKGITSNLTVINGSIMASGLYTFSVFLGDSRGYQAQTFYTLNIQPKKSLTTKSPNQIKDVVLFSQSSNINLSKVDSDQLKSRTKVQLLYDKLQSILTSYNMAKNSQVISYNNMLLAQQQSITFDQSFTSAQSNYNKILSYINEATTVIQNLKMQVSLGIKSTNISIAQVKKAQQIYNNIIQFSQNSTMKFNSSSELYATIQRQLSLIRKEVNLKLAQSISARNNYTLAVNNQEKAKIDLDSAKAQLSFASNQANKAQIYRELSMQDRDAAQNNLKSTQNTLKDVKTELSISLINLQQIRQEYENAKKQLGVAKFDLTLAQNSLFIAQAAKQASDKSLAIIVAQGNGNFQKSNFNFAGCAENGRPTIFGTARILKLGSNTINTSAGHTLIWGECTKKAILSIGTYIYYEGFIATDSISVKLVKTVTF